MLDILFSIYHPDEDVEYGLTVALICGWVDRGDGAAVYVNSDFGHPYLGHRQIVSYGSPAATLETVDPPQVLPDWPGAINWRYTLEGVYRGERL